MGSGEYGVGITKKSKLKNGKRNKGREGCRYVVERLRVPSEKATYAISQNDGDSDEERDAYAVRGMIPIDLIRRYIVVQQVRDGSDEGTEDEAVVDEACRVLFDVSVGMCDFQPGREPDVSGSRPLLDSALGSAPASSRTREDEEKRCPFQWDCATKRWDDIFSTKFHAD